jgi:predicted CXXCH cytochrome family protein
MSQQHQHPSSHRMPSLPGWIGVIFNGLNTLLVVAVLSILVWLATPFLRMVSQPHKPVWPSTMEEVDWHAPDSSKYCLSCHGEVGRATGGLAVLRGHSQNVPLNADQQAAVAKMGTVMGPGNTLICMSCHQLERNPTRPYMLADTLENSQLCQNCHPGHYARGTVHDLRQSAPEEVNRLGMTVSEGGPCSACHLAHSFARELASSDLDPEGYCLPCHAEYQVAGHHARKTMEHPESRCRECHDPHDTTHGEFLADDPERLCVKCHQGYADGSAGGMHPVGNTGVAIPESLRTVASDAHASVLSCAVCHDTHEAAHESLLRLTPETNELCLACHKDKLLEHSHDGVLPLHGQQPHLDEQQRNVVASWGNPVGPEGELLCVSCHGVHNAVPGTQVLSFKPKYGETCSACHPNHEGVVGSPHDLRIDFPELPNAAGLLPVEAGVCSPCHMAHQFPRARVPTPADPGGQCITCHREGECGQEKYTGAPDHPKTTCLDCHDPHQRAYGSFLKSEATQLCAECHPDLQTVNGGPHDIHLASDVWPAEALDIADACLSCHVPHGGERDDLFRFRVPTGLGNHDGVCLSCHHDTAWDADSAVAAIHPRKIDPGQAQVDLALVPTDAHGEKRMGCRTCHDPHGGAEPAHLARVAADEDTSRLCTDCHQQKRLMRYTGHSAESLANAGYVTDSCKPCHAMHAKRDGSWGELLSPRFLEDYRPAQAAQQADFLPCIACHSSSGHAPERQFTPHPEAMTNNIFPPDSPGYMPLFDEDGHVDQNGQVTCRTCHISHGRIDLLERIDQRGELSASEQRALKSQVRPFVSPNICIICHGEMARLLFLEYHHPQRRPKTGLHPRRN